MRFFSSPPPPPPPPPAPAPILNSLLEDPQAAVASLLESVVEYVNDPQFSIWTTASGEPNAWPSHNAAIAADDFYSSFVNPKVNARIAKLKEEAGR